VPKTRLDVYLVEKGLVNSRETARGLILANQVLVNQVLVDKAGFFLKGDEVVEIKSQPKYVSRGGDKLESVLQELGFLIEGLDFLDIGSSTGGFTDFLLQNGARRVFALDVGSNQLAWKLRQDPRVVSLENTHIRDLKPQMLPFIPDACVIDVSFISLGRVIPCLPSLLRPDHFVIPMFKPQFEVGRQNIGKGGIVKDGDAIVKALLQFCALVNELGYGIEQVAYSRLAGQKGNIEYFFKLIHTNQSKSIQNETSLTDLVQEALAFHSA